MNIPHAEVAVFAADTRAPVQEASLVLAACGIDYRISEFHPHSSVRWTLWVRETDQAQAHLELSQYWQEQQIEPARPAEVHNVDSGWPGVLGYLMVIWTIPTLDGMTGLDLVQAGRLHAGLVMQGERGRTGTAWTLHGDIAHSIANSVFGILFGLFVGRYLGSGLGWLIVLGCGAVANLLNALLQPAAFQAIGASTATFAALGLVPAFAWRRGYFRHRDPRRAFAPLFGAIAILSFTGFGGENTDIFGHLFGFAAGVGAGLAFAHIDLQRIGLRQQTNAAIACIGITTTAWIFAI